MKLSMLAGLEAGKVSFPAPLSEALWFSAEILKSINRALFSHPAHPSKDTVWMLIACDDTAKRGKVPVKPMFGRIWTRRTCSGGVRNHLTAGDFHSEVK